MNLEGANSCTNVIKWQHVSLDSEKYHSIFRDGPYAVMFSEFSDGKGRDVRVINLENCQTINTYKFEVGEAIVCFTAPHIASRLNDTIIRIWDINSHSRGPINTLDLSTVKTINGKSAFQGFYKAGIYGQALFILSTQNSTNPNYLTVLGNIGDPNNITTFMAIDYLNCGIDNESALLLYNNQLMTSQYFGGILEMGPIIKETPSRHIENFPDVRSYIKEYILANKEDFSKYKGNIIRHLVLDGNLLVGSTEKTINVWQYSTGKLLRQFSTKHPCELYSLEWRFLLGTTLELEAAAQGLTPTYIKVIKIWDVANGSVLFSTKHTSPHATPHCIYYKNRIYYVNTAVATLPTDTVIELVQPKPIYEVGTKLEIKN